MSAVRWGIGGILVAGIAVGAPGCADHKGPHATHQEMQPITPRSPEPLPNESRSPQPAHIAKHN